MRGERWLLRTGEFLVGLAARRLPRAVRDERYREWAAELPVILGDPEIRPAAARVTRMLWFAADTLRGAARLPGPARYRGAHRGEAGLEGARKSARWLGEGIVLLTVLAAMLAVLAFVVYPVIVGVSLAFYVVCLLANLVSLAACLVRGRSGGAGRYWFSAGAASAAGGGTACLAGQLGWGHPLLFTIISGLGDAVCAACLVIAGIYTIRFARRDRSPDMPERSGPGQ